MCPKKLERSSKKCRAVEKCHHRATTAKDAMQRVIVSPIAVTPAPVESLSAQLCHRSKVGGSENEVSAVWHPGLEPFQLCSKDASLSIIFSDPSCSFGHEILMPKDAAKARSKQADTSRAPVDIARIRSSTYIDKKCAKNSRRCQVRTKNDDNLCHQYAEQLMPNGITR